jgi:hypothetical protein
MSYQCTDDVDCADGDSCCSDYQCKTSCDTSGGSFIYCDPNNGNNDCIA